MVWAVLAPLIDEVGAAAIGRLFLWRRSARATHRACRRVSIPEFHSLEQFYGTPSCQLDWTWRHTARSVGLNRVAVDDGYFQSPVRSGFPENDRVWVRRWPSDQSELSVIGLGGLVQLGYYWFDRLGDSLAARHVEFWMMDEPYNHYRTPRGFLPGELIAGAGPEQLIAAVWQAIIDARTLIAHLRSRGRRVALVGQSYGGWLALLLALVEPEIECVSSLIPMCDLPAWYTAGLPLARGARRRFPQYSRQELDLLLKPINPIAWTPAVAPNRIEIHAATRDRMVLYHSIEKLATAWRTRFVPHRQGHYSVFFGARLREAVVSFILETAGQPPPPVLADHPAQ